MSFRAYVVAVILLGLLLAGCAQKPTTPVQLQTPTPAPVSSSKAPESPNLPEIPFIEHPGQLVFRSDSKGVAEISSDGELLILRGPHDADFSVQLSQSQVQVSGQGQGKLVFAARNDNLLYFSRMWVTGIESPSFAVLPGIEKPIFLKPGETVEYPVRVVPIGDFKEEVRLKAVSSSKYLIPQLSASGVPPFNATMKIKVTGWVGDGQHVKITGTSADKTVESYIRVNNPVKQKEGGLLSTLFRILWVMLLPVTVSFSMVFGTITGITAGAIGIAMLANPVTFFSPHFLDAIALGPSAGVAVTQEFLRQYSSLSPFNGVALGDGSLTGISTIAVGNAFKVLLPRVEFSPVIGQEVEVPIYVAGSGMVELNVTAPSAIEARIEPEMGMAPFKAKLFLLAKKEAPKKGLIFKKTRPYVVTINATSGNTYEVYKIYLKPVRKDYAVRLSSDLVYLEPGSFASVKAVVVRSNQFSPEEYSIRVATPEGIRAFVDPERDKTPYAANVTLYAEDIEMGRYTVNVGSAKLEVVAGRNGYAVVAPREVRAAQGVASNLQVDIYAIRSAAYELKVEFPFNYTVSKLNDYSYRIDIVPDVHTPPGTYSGRITYGEHTVPVSVLVTGVPVVVEYDSVVRVSKGERVTVTLNLTSAGYRGDINLNFTATPGIAVKPQNVVAQVPGKVEVEIANVDGIYGTVTFSGVVTYSGSPYEISGSIQVTP